MRVVHYLRRFVLEDGGVVRAVLDLAGALAARGHDVSLLTADAADVPEGWRGGAAGAPRVETVRLGGPPPRLARSERSRVERLLDEADVLHLHVPWDPVCSQLARVARRRGRPYVVSIHGMLDEWSMAQKTIKKRLYLALGGRRFLEQAAAVLCTAQAEADQSRPLYPRGRAAVLPLVFDLEPYRSLPGPSLARERFPEAAAAEPVLLFLSRLHHKKAVEKLIEAAALLRDGGRPVRVLIAGTGEPEYERRLRELVAGRDLEGAVSFLGFVKGVEKVSLYQAADLFVLPTSQENWGFVLLEALAAGTPVVTTRGVDIWPELESSGGAVIVEAEAGALATQIAGLLDDDRRRAAMGEAGRAWALEYLDIERVVDAYERLYAGEPEPGPA